MVVKPCLTKTIRDREVLEHAWGMHTMVSFQWVI